MHKDTILSLGMYMPRRLNVLVKMDLLRQTSYMVPRSDMFYVTANLMFNGPPRCMI